MRSFERTNIECVVDRPWPLVRGCPVQRGQAKGTAYVQ